MVGALIAFGWIAFGSLESPERLCPLIGHGERVSGLVSSSTAADPVSCVVEYDLGFGDEARRALIHALPGVDAAGRFRVESGGPPKPVELCFDPLDPAKVTFADTLDARVSTAITHQGPRKRGAWITLSCGRLVSACTFLPMKRLANAHGVPHVHCRDLSKAHVPPAEFGKYARMVGALGGLFVIFVNATTYAGSQRDAALASRCAPIGGERIESFADPRDDDDPLRFKLSRSSRDEGPRLERSVSTLGRIPAPRFEVEAGQTREVDLVIDPEDPRVVGFCLSWPWDLAAERPARSSAA